MENITYNRSGLTFFSRFEYVAKTPFLVFYGLFLVLALLLNIVAIACVIAVYVKRPATKRGLPKLGVILVICVLHVAYFAGPSALLLHSYKVDLVNESILSCYGTLAWELSFFVMPCLVKLLVASMALLEALRLQTMFIARCTVQVVTAVLLALASVIYVLVVIVPVFFMTLLEDNTEPCFGDTGFFREEPDQDRSRLIYVFDFIVPVIIVFLACLVLLLAYLTRKKDTSAVRYTVFSPQSLEDTKPAAVEMVGLNQPGPQSHSAAVTLPVNVLVAGVLIFVLNVVSFVHSFVKFGYVHDILFQDIMILWAAGFILAVLEGVFLPVCWILDAEIRSLFCQRSAFLVN